MRVLAIGMHSTVARKSNSLEQASELALACRGAVFNPRLSTIMAISPIENLHVNRAQGIPI